MKIIEKVEALQNLSKEYSRKGLVKGFVPTLGYLHSGHTSLIRKAREDCDIVIISIFVNPTQFGPGEDYEEYPRDIERDASIAEQEGVNIIFHPSVKEMYPKDYSTFVEVKEFTNVLCGASRPHHFRGVTTIVAKLFNAVLPDIAYFGQKDMQQAIVIERMVRDLHIPVEIKVLPIVREKDGLAVSSRNKYLDSKERKQARVLFESLKEAKNMVKKGVVEVRKIESLVRKKISKKNLASIDYVEMVSLEDLEKIEKIQHKALLAIAVYFGDTRLIDNVVLSREKIVHSS